MPELRGLPEPHQPSRRRSTTQTALFVGGAALALVVGSVAVSAQPSHKPGFRVDDNIGILRAAAVITELQQRGVIDGPDEVIAVAEDSVELRGKASDPSVGGDAVKAKGSGVRAGGGGGGGKGGKGGTTTTTTGGGTAVIGGGGTGSGTLAGSPTSYALKYGPGLLSSYVLTATPGTPGTFVDGLSAAAADASTYAGTTTASGAASSGSEPLNGEIRISSHDEPICGSDAAAGCTYTWYDGSRILKAEIQMRSWVSSSMARCLIGHELGHGLGLAHVNDASQLMNPSWSTSSPCSYQAGDAGGLTVMGSVKSTL